MRLPLPTLLCLDLLLTAALSAHAANAPNQADVQAEAFRQKVLALREGVAALHRLNRVGTPLLRVAAPYCPDRLTWSIGPLPRNAAGFGPEDKAAAIEAGYGDELLFDQIIDGTPAQRAGVQPGDRLVKVTTMAMPTDGRASRAFELAVQGLREKKLPVILSLHRGDRLLDVTVQPYQVCAFRVNYVYSDMLNAYATPDAVNFTDGILRFATQDHELATIMGHEIAHIVLRHPQQKAEQIKNGKPTADAHAKDKENDADYLGLYFAAAAGYDIDPAPEIWRRMATRVPSTIQDSHTSSHPSSPERFLRLADTVAEIHRRERAGQPMLPKVDLGDGRTPGEPIRWDGRLSTATAASATASAPATAAPPPLPAFSEVPFLAEDGRIAYQKFLTQTRRPRAFVLAADGGWGWRTGPNAVVDALTLCNRPGRAPCTPYVIDDRVVFDPSLAPMAPPKPAPASRNLGDALPASGFAALTDAAAVPVREEGRARYEHFLTLPMPRAIVVTERGGWSFWWNDPQAVRSALAWCERLNEACWLYAVDDRVVWQADPARRLSKVSQLPTAP